MSDQCHICGPVKHEAPTVVCVPCTMAMAADPNPHIDIAADDAVPGRFNITMTFSPSGEDYLRLGERMAAACEAKIKEMYGVNK